MSSKQTGGSSLPHFMQRKHRPTDRRAFLRLLGMSGVAAGAVWPAEAFAAAKKKTDPFPYTKEVRSLASGLKISTTRWHWIVAHHSAIKYGNATVYDKAHRERGMENGLAYHFVIGNGIDSGDGEIEIGPRWRKQLAGGHVHREDMNAVGIGICLVGNFESGKPTTKQIAALRELVDYFRATAWGKKLKFTVHKEVEPGRTACPGKNFPLVKMQMLYGKNKVPKAA
ncbi:MAG: Peptidoglycan-binding lysin domain protein [Verrucomicrobia bacterium]|nr:Peptidoglycan-binding lysin domain protein [Verrucomicrobiota bacterium]